MAIVHRTDRTPWWRFAIGEPEAFCERSSVYVPGTIVPGNYYDGDNFRFYGTWTTSTIGDDGTTRNFLTASAPGAYCIIKTSNSTGVELYVAKNDTYGNASIKIGLNADVVGSRSNHPAFAALPGRSMYGDTGGEDNWDSFKIISSLDSDDYWYKISPAGVGDTISIAGAKIFGDMTGQIQDDSFAFVFDVNPNSWDESIMGGTLEENMAGDMVLTKTQAPYREISMSGSIVSGPQKFNFGKVEFVEDMRTKFEWYANQQTLLYLVDDKGIANRHYVYIVPGSLSFERRAGDPINLSYSYSMTLREMRRD